MAKTFVTVTAVHDAEGKTKPLALVWTNGKQYEIDRVTDVRQAPSLRGGGIRAGGGARATRPARDGAGGAQPSAVSSLELGPPWTQVTSWTSG